MEGVEVVDPEARGVARQTQKKVRRAAGVRGACAHGSGAGGLCSLGARSARQRAARAAAGGALTRALPTTQYTSRPSPCFPAQECAGWIVRGQRAHSKGDLYVSSEDKNGVFRCGGGWSGAPRPHQR